MGANERFMEVVELVASDGPVRLTEIAQRAATSKATVHRNLRLLEERGWVERRSDGKYVLGLALVSMARGHLASDPLTSAAAAPMRRLRDELEETISLSREVNGTRVCVVEFPSPKALRHVHEVGAAAPLHAGASGKLLLAHMTRERRKELLGSERRLPAFTDKTRTTVAELEAECQKVARQGWAISYGERTAGSVAIAVPVSDGVGGVGALAAFAPLARFESRRDRALWTEKLQDCARVIEGSLGVELGVTGVA